MKKMINTDFSLKRAITVFIVLFFLTNMIFAITVLEKMEAKKRKEMEKNKITYVPTTSTPKLDRELAEQKKSRKRTYKIVEGPRSLISLCSPDGKTKYLTIDLDDTERITPLNENKLLYIYSKSALIDGINKKVKNTGYLLGVRIIDGHANTVKELNIGGFLNTPLVSEDGNFFIVPENYYGIAEWELPENPLNPAHFSTGNGIIAFDGNGNKLWEDEYPKGTGIDYNYKCFDISRSGKYTYITLLYSNNATKRYIYKRNGDKIMTNNLYHGWFSRNEDYFISYHTQQPAFIYDPITKNKTYVGINCATGHEFIDASGKEAGIAVAINHGILIITSIKMNMRIANIDYNSNYKLWNKAGREGTPDPPNNHHKGVYISKDGTEILVKTTHKEYRFKRKEN